MRFSFLQRRSTGYYFRQKVPAHFIEEFGCREVVKSLGKDFEKAKRDCFALASYYGQIFKGNTSDNRLYPLINGDKVHMARAAKASAQPNATAAGHGKTVSWLFEQWKAEHANTRSQSTISEKELSVRRFKELIGDLCIGDITPSHISTFKKALQSTNEYINKTSNGRISGIKSLSNYAFNNGYLKDDLLAALKVGLPENDSKKRLPYAAKDLETLFLNEKFKSFRESHPDRFWIPLIGLFTGARLGEIGQLQKRDFPTVDGIICFDINEQDENKRLKTKSSIRQVPIHNVLIKMGLLEYVESIAPTEKSFIFPQLKPYKDKRTHEFSKWFGRYKAS